MWKFETGGRVHGTPGISKGHVLAAGCDEFLHVLRLADGKSVTKVSMSSVSGASAAIEGSLAFVGTYGGHILGIDWVKAASISEIREIKPFPRQRVFGQVFHDVRIMVGDTREVRAKLRLPTLEHAEALIAEIQGALKGQAG